MFAFSPFRNAWLLPLIFALPLSTATADAPADRGEVLPQHARVRIGTTRLRHGDTVSAGVFAPDGKTIATAGREGVLSLWEGKTGLERVRYHGHKGAILAVAFAEGDRLVSGGVDGTARCWRVPRKEMPGAVSKGEEVRCFHILREEAQASALSADGKTAAAGTANGLIVVFDLERGKERQRWQVDGPIFCLALSADGKQGAVNRGASGLMIWDTDKNEPSGGVGNGVVMSLAFSADGRTLAAGYQSNRLVLWDTRRGTEIRALEGHERAPPGQPQGVLSLCFSADSRRLLSGGADRSVRLWDTATGEQKHVLTGHRDVVTTTAFSTDGKKALSGAADNSVRMWDTATGRSLFQENEQASPLIGLSLAPDGKSLVTLYTPYTLKLWDTSAGRERQLPAAIGDRASAAAFRPLGNTLAVAGSDDRLRFWDMDTRTVHSVERESPRRLQRLVWSHDGKTLASTGPDHHLDLWDAGKGELIRRVGLQEEAYLSLAFNRQDDELAAASEVDAIRGWECFSGLERPTIHARFAGALALMFSTDGRSLLTAGGDGRGRLWEMATRKARRTFETTADLTAAAFSGDGRFLATGESGGTVRVWDPAAGKELLVLHGHRGAVVALEFAARAPVLASASRDTTALVWDLADLSPSEPPPPKMLTERELDDLWSRLAGDAPSAYQALQMLRRAPGQATPYLRGRLQPVKIDIERLIAELDNDAFAIRQKASEELAGYGRVVEKPLRRTLDMQPSLEVRKRILDLLARMRDASDHVPAQARQIRCLELLESIGDAEARRLLRVLAGGIAEAELTRQASASLSRLSRHSLP
jgi:WD40 repeat protein